VNNNDDYLQYCKPDTYSKIFGVIFFVVVTNGKICEMNGSSKLLIQINGKAREDGSNWSCIPE